MSNDYKYLFEKIKNQSNTTTTLKSKLLLILTLLLCKIGIKPRIAEKLAPIIFLYFSIILGLFFLLFTFLIFFQPKNSNDTIKSNTYFEEINPLISETIVDASIKYLLPTRILLGIAGSQTSYGRYSPYDNIDRNPNSKTEIISEKNELPEGMVTSIFPTIKPAIGNIVNNGEGLGIYLLKFGPSSRAKIDPQNVVESTYYLAKLMRDKANELNKQGYAEPSLSETDVTKIDDFWSKVVSSLPIVDPLTNRCDTINSKYSIDVLISISLNCELDNVDKINFINYNPIDKTYYINNSVKNSDILIEETLRVAWYWAKKQKPEIVTWKDVKNIQCDNTKVLAGVLPISKINAKKIGVDNRCDTTLLLKNFSKYIINAHKKDNLPIIPNKKIYLETIIGWEIIPWALGNKKYYNEFIEYGNESEFMPNETCKKLTNDFLNNISNDKNIISNYKDKDTISEEYITKIFLDNSYSNPRYDSMCFNNSKITSDNIWITHLINTAESISIIIHEDNIINNDLNIILSILQNDVANNMKYITAIPSIHSLIPRFSSRYIIYSVPDSQYTTYLSSDLSQWSRFLTFITRLGGLSPNDPRAGQYFIGTSYTISIERVSFFTYPVFLKRQDSGLVSVNNCGGSNEVIMTPTYSFRWLKFCQDSLSNGNKSAVISSWRDPKKQKSLADNNAIGSVAKGISNHQRGIAVDISMGQSLDNKGDFYYVGSNNLTFRYLHSIKGCLDVNRKIYNQLSNEYTPEEYVQLVNNDNAPCNSNTIPIKRMQLFGIVPLCKGVGESWKDISVILCDPKTRFKGQIQIREPWHLEMGEIFLQIELSSNCNISFIDVGSHKNIAEAIKKIWNCELDAAGFNSLPAIEGPFYPALDHFDNLAQQISSEAILVAYCESGLNYNSGINNKYQGIFQLGEEEIKKYGDNNNRIDPANNIKAAVRYFIASYKNNHGKGWAGWGPWAVVNTNYYKTNPNVLVPIVGRFKSTHPERLGEYAPDLPIWAVDPYNSWGKGPNKKCLDIYKGEKWN
jgi:hypothetical protein